MRAWEIIGSVVVVVQLTSWKRCVGKIRGKYVQSKRHTDTRRRFTIQAECWLKSTDAAKRLAQLSVEQDRKPEVFELNPRTVD